MNMRSSLAKHQPLSPMSMEELYDQMKRLVEEGRGIMILTDQYPKLRNKHIEALKEIEVILYGERK